MKHKRRRKKVRQETQGTTAGPSPAAGGRDAPSPADGRVQRAIEEFQGGRVDQALRLCQEILIAEPENVDALNLAATITYRMGDSERTISLLKAVAAVQPNNAEAHTSLGDVLRWMQRSEEAVAAYRRALEIAPGLAEAHYSLGLAEERLGRFDEAGAAYRRALEIRPDHAQAHNNYGAILQADGKPDQAAAAYRRAIGIDPGLVKAHYNLAHVLIEQGDHRAALDACEACLEVDPGNTNALAIKAAALDEMGDRDGARFLIDLDRFIRPRQFDAPAGFDDLAGFNEALARHIFEHPLQVPDSAGSVTRLGAIPGGHLGGLLSEPKGPMAAFEEMVEDAVREYRHAQPADAAHPFLANPPRRWSLQIWGNVYNRTGVQQPHIHPGWLSGVYYVRVPAETHDPDRHQAGWIGFGRLPSNFRCAVEPETRAFRPEEGLMFLFPSYFYHHTMPSESADTRISIAFDVQAED